MKLFKNINYSGEWKYYIKDLYIFIISAMISILVSEAYIYTENRERDFVDRLYVYIYVLIPVFSASMIGTYIYRNRRIKETGKVRGSLRYRLTLALVFLSMFPSIPIFILSSNIIGKIIEVYYRIDVSNALQEAKLNIEEEESVDEKALQDKVEVFRKYLGMSTELNHKDLIDKALKLGMFQQDKYYLGYVNSTGLVSETHSLYNSIIKSEFKKQDKENFEKLKYYSQERAYIVYKIKGNIPDEFLLLGIRVHIRKENSIYSIINAEKSYNTIDLWKERVPFSLRLTLGAITMLTFGVSIILSFILARQISRPIVQLANATQRVSLGDYDTKLAHQEEGEMGILIDSFNQMILDLKSKNEELLHTQRIAAWKEVAQRMAHEIKNPLTPIQLSAERIRRKMDSPGKDKISEVIKSGTETIIGQVRVLEHLVREFSEFARMPSPLLINQELNPILKESVELFKGVHPDIKFDLHLSRNLPELFLDKKLFTGAMNNLVKNAIEAIHDFKKENHQEGFQGIIKITTKIERKVGRKSVLTIVEDNGPGLSQGMEDRVFEPYFSTKNSHGTGIGLTIVEKTVFDHHGHIKAGTSELGGCKFVIELPLQA